METRAENREKTPGQKKRKGSLKCSPHTHVTDTKSRPWLGTHRTHRSARGLAGSFRWHQVADDKVVENRKKKKLFNRTSAASARARLDRRKHISRRPASTLARGYLYLRTTEGRRVRLFELLASQSPSRLERQVFGKRTECECELRCSTK